MSLDCFYLTKTDRKKSELYESLKQVTNNEVAAQIEYNLTHTEDFKKWFANTDWEKDYESKNHNIPTDIMTANFQPAIFTNERGAFFKNIYGEPKYISASKLSDFSTENLAEIVSDISFAFVQDYISEHSDIRTALKSVNTDIKTFIRDYAKTEQAKYTKGDAGYARLELILNPKNLNDLTQLIKDNFKKVSVEIAEEVEEDEKTSGLNLKDSTTINSKDRATANIKLLVAFTPKRVLVDGKFGYVKGSYLNGVVTEDFDIMWRLLEDNLADIYPSIKYTENADGSLSTSFEPLYERYKKKLISKLKKHPSLLSVLTYIESKNSEYIKHQFVQALLKSKLNMIDVVVQKNGELRIMDSSQNTPGKKTAALWAEQFVFQSDLFSPEVNALNTATIKTVVNNYNNFIAEVLKSEDYRSFYPRLIKYLNFLKITGVTEEIIDELTGGTRQGFVDFVAGNTGSINNLIKTLSRLQVKDVMDNNGNSKNPFEDERVFFNIADKVAETTPNASETTILTKEGRAWLFDLVNFTNLSLGIWKDGEIQQLKDRLELPYYRNSRWAKRIIDAVENNDTEFLDNLKVLYLNNFRKGDDVKDNKDITLEEQILDSIAKMYAKKPMLNMLEPADKSRFMHIQGFDTVSPDIRAKVGSTDWTINNPEIVDIFYGYFKDEFLRVSEEQYKDSTVEFYKNNRLKFSIFEGVAEEVKHLITVNDRYMDAIPVEAEKAIRDAITVELNMKVDKTATQFKELEIVSSLPPSIKKQIQQGTHPVEQLAGMFTINGMIANIEMTKLFTGDPAYYKSMIDFKKRIPATYTNGMMLNLTSKDEIGFRIAVANDVKIGSAYLITDDDYVARVAEVTKASKELVKSILSDYSTVERTDAQAYITPERWKFLLTKLGKFDSDPKYEQAYQNIINGQPNAEDLKLAAQPLKGVYFSIQNGKPIYLKYSQSVLIPALVKGSQLEKLADKMSGKVDELIFLSGVKVGGTDVNTISNDKGDIVLPETLNTMLLDNRFWKLQQDLPTKGIKDIAIGSQIQKNIFADFDRGLKYNYYGTEVSGDDIHNTIDSAFSTLSTRGAKKFMKSISTDGEIDKAKLTKMILSEVKRSGNDENLIDAIMKELPYDAIPNFRQKIESIIFSKITSSSVKIKTSGGAFIQMANFGLDRLTDKENAGIIWFTEGNLKPPMIVDGKLQPGQVLLPSSVIAKYLPNYRSLSGAELKKKLDKELLELIGYRIPNQGMSSNDFLEVVGILPDTVGDTIVAYTEITAKTGSDFDIDKMYVMLPEMSVSYSNPRKVTNDFLDAVSNTEGYQTALVEAGLLKKGADKSDLIIELTKILTDENFESDSETVAEIQEDFQNFMKEHPAEVNKLKYVNHNGKDNKAINNRIFQAYKAILTHVNSYLPLVTSIDRSTQVIREDIASLYAKDDKKGFDHIDPLTELISKKGLIEGKNGVGTTANNLVDHVISQLYPLSAKIDIGFGHSSEDFTDLSQILDTTGKRKITDIISAFLNAFVDIAKDPYILRGNYNDFTTNTAFLLLRAGTPVTHVNRFIGQSALVEYARAKSKEKSSITPAFKIGNKEVNAKQYLLDKFSKAAPEEAVAKINDMSLVDIYNKYLSADNLQKNIENPNPETQYAVLKYFLDLQPVVSGLQEIVRATKSDVTGATSTAADRQVFEVNYHKARNNTMFEGVNERFDNTRFEAFYNNSVALAGHVASKLFLTETKFIRESKMRILEQVNPKLKNNVGAIKLINSEYYAFLMAGTAYASHDVKALLKEVPAKIMKYRNEFDNYLLKRIVVKQVKSNKIATADSTSDYEQNMMYKGWLELFKHKDPEVRLFARELIQYSYHTSGFKHGIGRFFSIIPHQWVGWEYIDQHMKELSRDLNADNELVNTFENRFMRQFVQHNTEKSFDNNALVPIVYKSKVRAHPTFPISKAFLVDMETANPSMKFKDAIGDIYPAKYVRTAKYGKDYNGEDIIVGYDLYEHRGYNSDFEGELYVWIPQLGMDELGNRVVEYKHGNKPESDSANNDNVSTVEENKIPVTPPKSPAVAVDIVFDMSMVQSMGDLAQLDAVEETQLDLFEAEKTESQKIYDQLGKKTVSNNVKITSWGEIKDATEPFTKYKDSTVHIISTRIKDGDTHFGNPFSSDARVIAQNKSLIKTNSTKESVIKYIDWVLTSNEARAQWIREQLQSGELQDKPILYYKELGEPSHATALDYLINKYKFNENNLDISEKSSTFVESNNSQVMGINISSRSTDVLGKRLTNPNWYAKDLMDVEAPYKANASKKKAPQLNAEEALKYDMNLMYKLQVQKFKKNPELIDEINERGGLEFIKQSSHIVGVKNSRWEGVGMKSNFITVLAQSYTSVAKELNKFIDSPVALKTDNTTTTLKEMFTSGVMLDRFTEAGINSVEDLDTKSVDELGELLKKLCK